MVAVIDMRDCRATISTWATRWCFFANCSTPGALLLPGVVIIATNLLSLSPGVARARGCRGQLGWVWCFELGWNFVGRIAAVWSQQFTQGGQKVIVE